jgi:hypothetical protein
VKNKWVVNASPLILLAKAAHIELLSSLTEELIIPQSVAREIDEGPATDPARQWLGGAGAQKIIADPPSSQLIAAWDLGAAKQQSSVGPSKIRTSKLSSMIGRHGSARWRLEFVFAAHWA